MNSSPTIDWLLARRIGLLGYGRDGRATARALRERDPAVQLTVLVERGEPETDWPVVNAPFDERLCDFDVLIRSPGVPVDHPALTAAREAGVVVVNPASIWLAERGRDLTVVGVTGSKGKSTTASLLAHLLRGQGLEVLLAGNIGVPLLDHLESAADVAVLELSSYQLADLQGRIDLGLFTRLFPEHLDWHGGEEAYVAAKLRLAELLEGRPLLVNGRDERLVAATEAVRGRVLGNRPPGVWRDGDRLMLDGAPLCPAGALPLIGRHNLDNAALALQAGILLGQDGPALARSLSTFRSLPHRLEPVATVDGVRFINDSISTSPWATLAALDALAPAPVILIAGGQARPADWQPVLEWVDAHGLEALLTIPDNGGVIADRFGEAVGERMGPIEALEGLEQAVARARELAREGCVVLLSPGAPSFTRFRDFEERGERFRAAVGVAPEVQ
ncbi:UDP-N-acetylmuramoyl-L-alanine--D-glutamate ligase [Wenzhouxiangella sediminis]|uniref:UDP-N-acetylmuramoylalanine--D-glutamate ligase n=1 Tax=Wenzhouxiangella sediminis TaxID=1792836 RepID=A0A3E1K7T0_9GAMM|nr:UDP-N-acetylmuramoyl-L-alanine--D-glutamate ligase [Wenzhouxiangella sediminis]RFF30072.1 UDP-N-acetylmuramoyl-L-alanine--D-glutamate ligase [Wenzhouxiangella sediminis]